MTGATIRLAVS